MTLSIDVTDVCVTPVSAEAPAGEDSRYAPEYVALLDEIEKLTSVTKTGSVSWPRVAEMACEVLRTRSKDLQAACYLAVALAETDGMSGLATGTHVLTDFARNYWETGFPAVKRLRGRVNALDWWRERTRDFLEAHANDAPLSADLYRRVGDELAALDEALGEVLADYQPLRDLKEAARHLNSAQEAPQTAPPAAPPAAAAAAQPVAPQTPAPSPDVASQGSPVQAAPPPTQPVASSAIPSPQLPLPVLSDDAAAARTHFLDFALAYARQVHAAAASDPLPWRVQRLAVWEKIASLPPSEGRATFVPPPDMERKALWEKRLAAGGDAATLAALALSMEDLAPSMVFWLDLHRLIAEALQKAGPEYALAATAVRDESRRFANRLPGLGGLTFADGTPFADAATREWLATAEKGGGTAQGTAECLRGQVEAERQAGEGKLDAALAALDTALGETASNRERFSLRLMQARYLCRAGEWLGATALTDSLLNEADTRQLASWEPEKLVDLLFVAHEAWQGLGGETGTRQALEMRRRLFALKPSVAFVKR